MLTQTSEYALRALCALAARPGETIPAADLATQAGVPNPYLAKIMQALSAAEFVEGRRGIGGGYALAFDPAKVTVLEVVLALGPIRTPRTAAEIDKLADGFADLHRCLDLAAQSVLDRLHRTTIADIAQNLDALAASKGPIAVRSTTNGRHQSVAG